MKRLAFWLALTLLLSPIFLFIGAAAGKIAATYHTIPLHVWIGAFGILVVIALWLRALVWVVERLQ